MPLNKLATSEYFPIQPESKLRKSNRPQNYLCGGATVGTGSDTRRITIHAYSAADTGASTAIAQSSTIRSSSSPSAESPRMS